MGSQFITPQRTLKVQIKAIAMAELGELAFWQVPGCSSRSVGCFWESSNGSTWPDADGRKMAIYRPFWGKRIANLTGLKFQELRDRHSLRLCGESVVLCNNWSVIAHKQLWTSMLGFHRIASLRGY